MKLPELVKLEEVSVSLNVDILLFKMIFSKQIFVSNGRAGIHRFGQMNMLSTSG